MEKSFEERVAEAKSAVQSISPEEAHQRRNSDSAIVFIDPRSPADISATTGIIPGAINLQLDDLSEKADSALPQELSSRSRPIIAACEGGPMGALAAYALKQRGFDNVSFIDGGTRGWLDAGYQTAR
ncbi:MAG: rhodanese-like domain-containing protein [Gammaproteobacteria bacterium]|jgi:rhodanese-related sulfurtransferase